MNKIKFPKIILIIALLAISAWFFSTNAPIAKAATVEELLAQVAALQAQIAQLQQQLAELQGKPTVWCHDFNTNLRIGDSGSEITALRTALQKEGLLTEVSEEFDEKTASAVVGFQEKYRAEILTPLGLKHGTGFVGKTTRAKLNALYGCGVVSPYIRVISPNGGESWVIGNTYEIKWDSSGFETVFIVVRNYETGKICRLTPGYVEAKKGIYQWKVGADPCPVTPGDKYKIGVYQPEGMARPRFDDESDNYFSIVEKEIELPDLTLIAIRTDVYHDSFTFTICNEGNTDLYKSYADIDVKVTVNGITKTQGILSANLRAGSCTYGGPQFLYTDFNLERGKSYDLTAVVDPNNEFEESNELNNTFRSELKVPIETKSVTVISPNGGESWVVGNTYQIRVQCSFLTSIDLWLTDKYAEGGTVTKIASGLPCGPAGTMGPELTLYNWTIPSFIVPRENSFKVVAKTIDGKVSDDSDNYFSIVSTTAVEYEVNPYDADVKTCTDSAGKVWPATGEGAADWFVWGGCTHNKYYFVNPGQQLRLHAYTDSCPGCVCYFPNFYLYEYENGAWVQKKYFDLPDVKGITRDEYYTPSSNRIKIYAPSCFYLKLYSPQSVEIPAGYEVSNVRLNGNGNSITVKPGQSVSVSLDYKIWSRTGCPGCIDQIVLGMDDKPLTCVYNGIPGIYPGKSGSYSGTITAPDAAGTYYLYTAYYTQYTCEDAMNIYPTEHYGKPLKIGTIVVTPEEASITIISPNGGEVWAVGETRRVSWKSSGVKYVRIYVYDETISGSGSTNYIYDGALPADTGYYDWTIIQSQLPGGATLPRNYKIRIDGVNETTSGATVVARDWSDDYFSIGVVAPSTLKDIENQLASIGAAISQILEGLNKLMGR